MTKAVKTAKIFAMIAGLTASVALGFGSANAAADFCPGTDYCYTASGCKACVNMECLGSNCPDPGEQGSNCYVCSTIE